MILTGRAKDDFLSWYGTGENYFTTTLKPIEQYANIIEWLDLAGIYICIENHYKNFSYEIKDKGNVKLYSHMFAIHSRQAAIKQAIEYSNEIYNNR